MKNLHYTWYAEIEVQLGIIVHRYENINKEIEAVFSETDFMKKIIAICRIHSISEKYILVKSSYHRIIY